MIDWKIVTLKDLCTEIKYGFTASSTEENTGIKFLRITDIASENLNWNTVPYCVIADSDYQKYKIEKNDVVIARTGATVGYAKMVREIKEKAVFASYLIKLKFKEGIDGIFMGILIESNIYKNFIHTIAGGSAQPNANAKDLTSFKFRLPPPPIQQKIAAILSAYDDLTVNNNKRIALLEKAAEEIYREWFVRMRFPGWEAVRFVKGVPEGWERGSFTDYIDVMSGGTPKTDVPQYWDGDIPWFTPRDLHDSFFIFDTERRITEDGLRHCASKLYPPNTIFITARGTVGNCVMNVVPMAMSQTSYALLGKNNLPQYYVFYLTLSMVANLKQQATGAVFDTIVVDTFRKQKVVLPSKPIIEKFMSIVAPMLEQLKALQQKNEKLKQSRDLLLARLISGKLSVDGLDIHFPPSMVEDSAG